MQIFATVVWIPKSYRPLCGPRFRPIDRGTAKRELFGIRSRQSFLPVFTNDLKTGKNIIISKFETQDKYFTSTTKGGRNGEHALFRQFLKNCICGDARGTVLEIMEHSSLILQSC